MTRQLQSERSTSICFGVSMTRLFAFFIALSLLFGPLAMDRAMASAPAQIHSQISGGSKATLDHCQPADQDKTHKAMPKPCCTAICATIAVMPQASADDRLFETILAIPAPASVHRGVLSEIATPPPRAA